MPPKPRKRASAAVAREAEVDEGVVIIEQCGVTLRIPTGGKVPYRAVRAFLRGDEDLGTELLLGEEQWAALMAKNPTVDDMNEIGTKLEEASGN